MANIPNIEVYVDQKTIVVDIRSRFSSEAYKWVHGEADKLLKQHQYELPVQHTCFMIRDTLNRELEEMTEAEELHLDDSTGLWALKDETCIGWESAAVTAKEIRIRKLEKELEEVKKEVAKSKGEKS